MSKLITYIYVISIFFTSCSTSKKIHQTENLKKSESWITPKEDVHTVNSLLTVKAYVNQFNTHIYWKSEVKEFYHQRDYHNAWLNSTGINESAEELLRAIEKSNNEGLNKYSYNYLEILNTRHTIDALQKQGLVLPSLYAKLDILLSHSYLEYAFHLLSGKLNPNEFTSIWEIGPRKTDLTSYLEKALSSGSIAQSLYDLTPKDPQYGRLKQVLNELKVIQSQEKWPVPGYTSTLQKHDSSEYVYRIKKFLAASNDLNKTHISGDNIYVYDHALELAVKHFQSRHGLDPDGVIGEKTLTAMNKSLQYRIEQVKVNMERMRWMPERYGEKYITVNLPEFKLRYYVNDTLNEKMNVIVGKSDLSTPILTDTLDYIEFNPFWNVPRSIATKELLPKIKRDVSYLKDNNFLVFNHYTTDTSKAIDPENIEWQKMTEDNFPYQLVQLPGQSNSLGIVKFIFDNIYDIYLHDTPAGYLFNKSERDLSHGCIRVERPLDLVASMFKESKFVNRDTLVKYVQKGTPRKIFLDTDIKVFMIYQTVWVNNDGDVHFRRDIYNHDRLQYAHLNQRYYYRRTDILHIKNKLSALEK